MTILTKGGRGCIDYFDKGRKEEKEEKEKEKKFSDSMPRHFPKEMASAKRRY